MKKGTEILFGIILAVLLLIGTFGPLFGQVWKVGEIRSLALHKERLKRSLTILTGEKAALEAAIAMLSHNDRLERYARDTLGLVLPEPQQVLLLRRKKDGSFVGETTPLRSFIEQVMGRPE